MRLKALAEDHTNLALSGVTHAERCTGDPTLAIPPAADEPTFFIQADLTLRPMRYPQFFEMYKDAIEHLDRGGDRLLRRSDRSDRKLMPAEKHLISRLVAFFATGDSIVANNLVLNLYQHINAPEARMYLPVLNEEALHVQFYLNLLDNHILDHEERAEAFAVAENILHQPKPISLQVDGRCSTGHCRPPKIASGS